MTRRSLVSDVVKKYKIDELISIDVQTIALQRGAGPMPGTQESKSKSSSSRKNSDDDYFVEETLLFTFAGSSISTE